MKLISSLTFVIWTFNSVFMLRVLNFFRDSPLNLLRMFDNKHLYIMKQR